LIGPRGRTSAFSPFSPPPGVRQLREARVAASAAGPPLLRTARPAWRRQRPCWRAAAAGRAAPRRPSRPRGRCRRCFPQRPAGRRGGGRTSSDRAADLFDAGDYQGALVCAEEAARQAPRSVEAHHNRAVALLHSSASTRRATPSRALAARARDPETLEAAAASSSTSSRPRPTVPCSGSSTRAGPAAHAGARQRPTRAARAPRGQALIDLGRPPRALRRLDASLAATPDVASAEYERASPSSSSARSKTRTACSRRCSPDDLRPRARPVSPRPHRERQGNDTAAPAPSPRRRPRTRSRSAHAIVTQPDFAARVKRAVDALAPESARPPEHPGRGRRHPAQDDLTAKRRCRRRSSGSSRPALDWNAREPLPTQAGRPSKKGRARTRRPAAAALRPLDVPIARSSCTAATSCAPSTTTRSSTSHHAHAPPRGRPPARRGRRLPPRPRPGISAEGAKPPSARL